MFDLENSIKEDWKNIKLIPIDGDPIWGAKIFSKECLSCHTSDYSLEDNP